MARLQPPSNALVDLRAQGTGVDCPVLDATSVATQCRVAAGDPAALQSSWRNLLSDEPLRIGGRSRRRRFGCYIRDRDFVAAVQHNDP